VRNFVASSLLSLSFFLAAGVASAQEISVAAASDLSFAMPDLAAGFQKQTGIKVNATFGSSGNFFSQIQHGAPFDIFFSADVDYPRKLDAAGFCEPGTLYEYATGKIVVWAAKDSPLDIARLGWKALLDSRVQRIAIANPAHAPYGRAAVAALKSAGILAQVRSKLVYGENISQTAQFVQSGNAQIGILALSIALSPTMQQGRRWEIPDDSYPLLIQAAVVLKSSKAKNEAKKFLDFIKSAAGREILDKYGFRRPPRN